jgi:hypothetical protein
VTLEILIDDKQGKLHNLLLIIFCNTFDGLSELSNCVLALLLMYHDNVVSTFGAKLNTVQVRVLGSKVLLLIESCVPQLLDTPEMECKRMFGFAQGRSHGVHKLCIQSKTALIDPPLPSVLDTRHVVPAQTWISPTGFEARALNHTTHVVGHIG